MSQPKVSAVFLAFVEPVFLARGGPPAEMYREIFNIAVIVWNAVLLDDHQDTDYLSGLRSRLRLFEEPSRTLMTALVEDFIDRRRGPFAQHQWLVGDWEVFHRANGEPRVRVEARALSTTS